MPFLLIVVYAGFSLVCIIITTSIMYIEYLDNIIHKIITLLPLTNKNNQSKALI